MTPEERQAALDNISAEDLAKIQRVQGKTVKVEQEDLLLAEFAKEFGWQAYLDVKSDKVKSNEMIRLLAATRKLKMQEMYRNAQAAFIAHGAVNSKKPSQAFKSMTQNIVKNMEADK